MEDQELKDTSELIETGSEIVGGLGGAAIGLLIAGPGGALAGAVGGPLLTKTIKRIGSEIQNRVLGKREEIRVGATLSYALAKIKDNLDKGKTLREDGFFNNETNRSDADEILEGTLLSAQKEYEEKKIPFMANLFANIAFNPNIDKGNANHLIKLANTLSYRQLCLINIFTNKSNFPLRSTDYTANPTVLIPVISILHEIFELYTVGLINCESVIFGLTNINPSKMKVEGAGEGLYVLMELNSISNDELNKIANLLR